MTNKDSMLSYYAQPGMMTDLTSLADELGGLPKDVPSLCKLVQKLYLHIFWRIAMVTLCRTNGRQRCRCGMQPRSWL